MFEVTLSFDSYGDAEAFINYVTTYGGVIVEDSFTTATIKSYTEEDFFQGLKRMVPRAANALQEYGFTLQLLRELPPKYGSGERVRTEHVSGRGQIWTCWWEILDIRYVGWGTLDKFVAYCRSRQIEFPWFAEYDRALREADERKEARRATAS